MNYFDRLLELLRLERQEDRQAYRQLIQRTSVAQRRTEGLSWYPVAIRGTEPGRGDYLTVEVERTTHHDTPHQLRFGMPAVLFSNHDPGNDRVEGVIAHLSGNTLQLALQNDELPEWTRSGKLGVDLLFDENSYEEMISALGFARNLAAKEGSGQLVKVLIGAAQPAVHPHQETFESASLNFRQTEAVNRMLNAEHLAIVHGPPGTGKTTTLVQGILGLVKQDKRPVLVVAPSNTAVDLLAEKLAEAGVRVVRIGNPVRVSERLLSLTLDNRVQQHAATKELKNMKKRANEFRTMAHKYKRNFGAAEREQRKALFDEAHRIMRQVNDTEQSITEDVLSGAQVIAATLVGANHFTVRKLSFHTVVMDEAGQSLEPAAWIPIVKAAKLILAGDHWQLPPTVKSMEAARGGLTTTLLEKLVALYPQTVTLLEEQYRMHETIMGYSSRVFYENKLIAHGSVAERLLFAGDRPLEFVDTAGCGFEEKNEGTSISNPEEAAFLFRHLNLLIAAWEGQSVAGDFPSIAVISPYKQQVNLLKEYLEHNPALKKYAGSISVNTIDAFQGQERDIVYISLTRSNAEGTIGFLSDRRRMNVAMTRARKKLVVIGDSATLSRLPFYAAFVEYAQERDGYRSAWEFMTD